MTRAYKKEWTRRALALATGASAALSIFALARYQRAFPRDPSPTARGELRESGRRTSVHAHEKREQEQEQEQEQARAQAQPIWSEPEMRPVDIEGLGRAVRAAEACIDNDHDLRAAVVEVSTEAVSETQTRVVGSQLYAAAGEASPEVEECIDKALLDLLVTSAAPPSWGDTIWLSVDDAEGHAATQLAELTGAPTGQPPVDGDALSLSEHLGQWTRTTRGAKEPQVEIAVCSAFDCPFSRRAALALAETLDTDDRVALVYLHAGEPGDDSSQLAARAAVAAEQQGAFWAMHDLLFERPASRTYGQIEELAHELKLDGARFSRDMESPETRAQLDADAAFCEARGAHGTPTFLIGDEIISGTRSVTEIVERVRNAMDDP